MHHATGTFAVTVTPEAQEPAPQAASRPRDGTFQGFLRRPSGTAKGTMLSAGEPKPGAAAAYVAIDQFQGMLNGRGGGFILAHRGTMAKSGTHDLAISSPRIAGRWTGRHCRSLTIEVKGGQHHYDLAYTLAASRDHIAPLFWRASLSDRE